MNLTYQKEIVIPVKTYKAIEGYVIAIFERQRDSRICRGIYSRKDGKAKIARWKKWIGLSNFDTYAVSTFSQFRYEFVVQLEHHSQVHALEIAYTLEFNVIDAESICIHIESDPLWRFCSEIARSVGDSLSSKPWPRIVGDFKHLAREILEETEGSVSRFDQLNRFGAELGLRMTSLKMLRRLENKDLQVAEHKDKLTTETELFTMKRDAERHKEKRYQADQYEDELYEQEQARKRREEALLEEEDLAERERMEELRRHTQQIRIKREEQTLEHEKAFFNKMIDAFGDGITKTLTDRDSHESVADIIETFVPIFERVLPRRGDPIPKAVGKSNPQKGLATAAMGEDLFEESKPPEFHQAHAIIAASFCDPPIKEDFLEIIAKAASQDPDHPPQRADDLKTRFSAAMKSHGDSFNKDDRRKLVTLFNHLVLGTSVQPPL